METIRIRCIKAYYIAIASGFDRINAVERWK
jgi:hypothetical protein